MCICEVVVAKGKEEGDPQWAGVVQLGTEDAPYLVCAGLVHHLCTHVENCECARVYNFIVHIWYTVGVQEHLHLAHILCLVIAHIPNSGCAPSVSD
jgi:hypothetical protein